MPTLSGYDIGYSHRGSWKADRRFKGQLVDTVPVAWDKDWTKKPGEAPTLIVWYERPEECKERFERGESFVVAVAKRVEGGSSSQNIHGLFEVFPLSLTNDPQQVLCRVDRRCPLPENQ